MGQKTLAYKGIPDVYNARPKGKKEKGLWEWQIYDPLGWFRESKLKGKFPTLLRARHKKFHTGKGKGWRWLFESSFRSLQVKGSE